ncbi:MAG: bifunctional precorrin-2 dehydrogenase/sirohydrochlorin ferrochelatase [bacterium]|nr:bifunctional precorrin-2 dehydrogenase/sirohydrochlorin ferrochelatase [bacterium]
MNPYYPVFIKIKDKTILVVGGGKIAERKVHALLERGARVTVVSPDLTPQLQEWAAQGRVSWRCSRFAPGDLDGARLAICATNDGAVNGQVAAEADARGVWLNVVDKPDLCEFIVPSAVLQGDLTIAISTGGSSPALAKKIRRDLEALFGPEYAMFLALLRKVRPFIQRDIAGESERMAIFSELAHSTALDLMGAGRQQEAEREVRHILARHGVRCPVAWDGGEEGDSA